MSFKNGAFVFTRTRGLQPMSPEEVKISADALGIPREIVPSYPGDGIAFRRSVERVNVSKRARSEGYLLRPIVRNKDEVVYGIVREDCDLDNRRLEHDHEAVVGWHSSAPGQVSGSHGIAEQVREMFTHLQGKIIGDDWAIAIRDWLLGACKAAKVRNDGRVYWVPPAGLPAAKNMGKLLEATGVDLILCELTPEQVKSVATDVAQSSLAEDLDALVEEAAKFDGEQKPSTYERRLTRYQELKDRAVTYRDSLGLGVEKMLKVLDELDSKVGQMLDVRRSKQPRKQIHRKAGPGPDSSSSGNPGGVAPMPSSSSSSTSPAPTVPAPAMPQVPQAPQMPQMPQMPAVPQVPTGIQLPQTPPPAPRLPQVPQMPTPGIPEPGLQLPQVPTVPQAPQAPQAPQPTQAPKEPESSESSESSDAIAPKLGSTAFTRVNGDDSLWQATSPALLAIFDGLYRQKKVGKDLRVGGGRIKLYRRGPVVHLELEPGADRDTFARAAHEALGLEV